MIIAELPIIFLLNQFGKQIGEASKISNFDKIFTFDNFITFILFIIIVFIIRKSAKFIKKNLLIMCGIFGIHINKSKKKKFKNLLNDIKLFQN